MIVEMENKKNALREYKEKNGLTVAQVANAVGISIATVKLHLNGKVRPKAGLIRRYASVFGIRPYDLFSIASKGWPADLMGQRFGFLLVTDYVGAEGERNNSSIMWRCVCDCGNIADVRSSHLVSGYTRSCGCYGRSKLTAGGSNKLSEGMAAANSLRSGYQRSAKARHLEWQLTPEEFLTLTSGDCYYCGSSPHMTHQANGENNTNGCYTYNGIDRVDNSKGYLISNVVSCCRVCNVAKASMTVDAFLAWIEQVYKHTAARSTRFEVYQEEAA
jgi:transcriptional regulator with XRE-family HTH domain